MSDSDRLGKVAHSAWCEASGEDHPLWENLSADIQAAWCKTAEAVLLAIGEKSGLIEEDETPNAA